jgi:small subunit ribosomal protein S9
MMERVLFRAVGRRKAAIARVQVRAGAGEVIVNGKPVTEHFPTLMLQKIVAEPLQVVGGDGKFSVMAKVVGGGVTGQADAVSHGLARALCQVSDEYKPLLRKAGLLTRDPRVKERKKYGLKRARKAPQYTKR